MEEAKIEGNADEETALKRLLIPGVGDLPPVPPSAIDSNFVPYFAPGLIKPGHDQYVYRHANGLCVIGLAPTHLAFKDEGGVTAVDYNVGKSDRSGMKVTGKRKKNAQHFESNTALCEVCTKDDTSYIIRCCVKGSLLEVNDRLIKQPSLLNSVMVSDASKKKAAQKKAAAAAKRGGKAVAAAASSKAAATVDDVSNGVDALQISDRTCTGVLCSHPLSRDVRVIL